MTRPVGVVVAALAVAAVVAALVWPRAEGSPASGAPAPGERAPPDPERASAASDPSAGPERREHRDPAAGAELTVRVHWSDDGSPAAGVGIALCRNHDSPAAHTAVADDAGTARFDGLAPGRWLTRASWHDPGTELDLAPGESSHLDLALFRCGRIEGRVVDPAGAPIAGARVLTSGRAVGAASAVATADEDGRFAFTPWAVVASITAEKRGHGRSQPVRVTSLPGETTRIELVLGRGAHPFRGRVVDPRGEPVAGARVFVDMARPTTGTDAPLAAADGGWLDAATGADGRFAFDDVLPGQLVWAVASDAFAPATGTALQPERADGACEIALGDGRAVEGTVRDDLGRPVAGAWIEAARADPLPPARSESGADGRYAVTGLGAGAVDLAARHDLLGTARERVVVGAGSAVTGRAVWDPVLRTLPAIDGRVVDDGGAPLRGLVVRAWPAREANGVAEARTGPDGGFALRAQADAEHTLVVIEPAALPTHYLVRMAGVRPGRAPIEVVIRAGARPSAFLSGRILRAAGGEDELLRVRVREHALGFVTMVGVGADGAFRVGPLPPSADWRLAVLRGRSQFNSVQLGPFAVRPHEERDLGMITLEAPTSLEFAPRRSDGRPIQDPVDAELLRAGDRQRVAFVRWHDGATHVADEGMAPGVHVLVVRPGPDHCGGEGECTLTAGRSTRVEVALEPARRVRVVLVRAAGGAPERASVECREVGGRIRRASVLGGERVIGLARGRWHVEAEAGSARGEAEVGVDDVVGAEIAVTVELR